MFNLLLLQEYTLMFSFIPTFEILALYVVVKGHNHFLG
jgi:hypothetical protein